MSASVLMDVSFNFRTLIRVHSSGMAKEWDEVTGGVSGIPYELCFARASPNPRLAGEGIKWAEETGLRLDAVQSSKPRSRLTSSSVKTGSSPLRTRFTTSAAR